MIALQINITCGACGWRLQPEYPESSLVPNALWCGNAACPNAGKKFDPPSVELKERQP